MTQATILVVEDEGIVAQEIKSRLEKAGYTVCGIVHDGQRAVAQAEALSPDLVLMDIRLKGDMDGIEAAGLIGERCHIPVVYLTAHTDAATLERAKVNDPLGYVVKPFDTRSLTVAVEIALHRHRSESERIYREKLEAVIEAAGAVCHELNQPIMAVSGHVELLLDMLDSSDPHYNGLAKIKAQVDRMGAITRKLMGITRYETRQYVNGERIVDLDKSSTTIG